MRKHIWKVLLGLLLICMVANMAYMNVQLAGIKVQLLDTNYLMSEIHCINTHLAMDLDGLNTNFGIVNVK